MLSNKLEDTSIIKETNLYVKFEAVRWTHRSRTLQTSDVSERQGPSHTASWWSTF